MFDHLPEVWVLELSSFQLDGATGFAPDAATVLNITDDHLDWHGSMAAYAAALEATYPGRRVEAALLYTQAPRLIEIPADLLAVHKQALTGAQESF